MSEYAKLIKRVKTVNRIAALRLAREIPLLAKRGVLFINKNNKEDLSIAFLFVRSKQGHDYWKNVCKQIGDW